MNDGGRHSLNVKRIIYRVWRVLMVVMESREVKEKWPLVLLAQKVIMLPDHLEILVTLDHPVTVAMMGLMVTLELQVC